LAHGFLADQATKLANFPEALQVLEFANGLVSLVAVPAVGSKNKKLLKVRCF